LIVQCPACRALVRVTELVRAADDDGEGTFLHAGFVCSDCRVTTFLPLLAAPRLAETAGEHPVVSRVAKDLHAPVDAVSVDGPARTDEGKTAAVDEPVAAPTTSAHETASVARPFDTIARALSVLLDENRRSDVSTTAGADGETEVLEARPHDARQRLVDALLALGDRWDSKDAHKGVVGEATRSDELAFLGQCYRAVIVARPDDKGATVGRELVLAHAMATMNTGQRDGDDLMATAKRMKAAAIAVGVIFLVVALAFMLRHMTAALTELNGAAASADTGAP